MQQVRRRRVETREHRVAAGHVVMHARRAEELIRHIAHSLVPDAAIDAGKVRPRDAAPLRLSCNGKGRSRALARPQSECQIATSRPISTTWAWGNFRTFGLQTDLRAIAPNWLSSNPGTPPHPPRVPAPWWPVKKVP